MTLPRPRMATYADYAALPDDGNRYELLEGRLVLVPAPLTAHQRGSSNMEYPLMTYVKGRNLGEVFHAPIDVILDEHNTVQPDVVFVAREHADRIGRRGIEGAPDLVVEILSESTASRDCIEKRELYERVGVQEYWIVNPEARSILVLALEAGSLRLYSKATGEERIRSRLFPDLDVAPAPLFEPPKYDKKP